MIDGNGIPLVATTTKANVHDLHSALPTIDRFRIGNRLRRPKRLGADKGYDSAAFRRALRKRGIKPAIRSRNFKNRRANPKLWNDSREIRYSRCRWKVERRIACLDQNRRLDFLFERTREQYETFMKIAFIRCYLKMLARTRKPEKRVWR